MAEDRLKSFLVAFQNAFDEGRFSDIADFFTLPLVIYTVAGVTVVRNAEQLVSLTEQYHEAIGALEIASTTFQVQHRDLPYNRRLRATVRFTDLGEDGRVVTGSLIRYFLVEEGDRYKIEMLEYLEVPLPLSEVERIVH